MFWERFYFVVILLSCNCFLLCSNWFCEFVKKLCGWDNQNKNTHGISGEQGGNLNNNIYNNINLVNEKDNLNGEEENNDENNEHDDILHDCKFYKRNNIEDVIDLSGCEKQKNKITSNLKCVFLSATTFVGKTSILKYIAEGNFDEACLSTISSDFFRVFYKVKNTEVKMQILLLDASGDKKYKATVVNNQFLGKTNAIVFVYDITNSKSFDNLQGYIAEVKEKAPKDCLFFLLGNKLDIVEQNQNKRQVTTEKAQNLAADKHLIFLGECSAKTNTYIPAKGDLYCKKKDLIDENEKCKEGLSGMLKDIIYGIFKPNNQNKME